MDAIVSQIQDAFEGTIDFEGQKLSDLICTVLLSLTSILALVNGFMLQDIYVTVWLGLGGTILTMLIVVPPWPFYNTNPKAFAGSRRSLPAGGIVVGGKKLN